MTSGPADAPGGGLRSAWGGAAPAATGRPGPLQAFYQAMVARGMREELARVTPDPQARGAPNCRLHARVRQLPIR
jgi:hypothetical protein